jgi:hypothetical protein
MNVGDIIKFFVCARSEFGVCREAGHIQAHKIKNAPQKLHGAFLF